MRTKENFLDCENREFTYEEFNFNYQSDTDDKELLDKLTDEGLRLAKVVNPTLARDASRIRDYQTIQRNCIGGVIAEYCWRHHLESRAQKSNANVRIVSEIFKSRDKHIDIGIYYGDGLSKTVEVRSSFPYTGLENAVCRAFDILGWYVNPVKKEEIRKSYYVRTLYAFHIGQLYSKLKSDSFSAFLTGGATRRLLEEGPFSRDKKLTPFDDTDATLSSKLGTYRVVEPIANAYDTPEITRHILNRTT